jgi:hypothetical protein
MMIYITAPPLQQNTKKIMCHLHPLASCLFHLLPRRRLTLHPLCLFVCLFVCPFVCLFGWLLRCLSIPCCCFPSCCVATPRRCAASRLSSSLLSRHCRVVVSSRLVLSSLLCCCIESCSSCVASHSVMISLLHFI